MTIRTRDPSRSGSDTAAPAYHREKKSMLLSWFNAAAAKEFGIGLAKFYVERIPVASP